MDRCSRSPTGMRNLRGADGKSALAGSDSHTRLGWAKPIPKSREPVTAANSVDGLKRGRTVVFGEAGSYPKLMRAVLDISCGMMGERRWTLALAPLMSGVPLVVLAIVARELAFAHHWGRHTNRLADAVPELSR